MKILHWILLLLTVSGLFWQCAQRGSISGGPRDEQPPRLDTLLSTPNFQTNFEKQRIELTFDEWLQLDDVFNQVVVSPPLEFQPEVTLRGKTVRFDFDEEEVLRENATYTINFGEAVQDLTEGNAPEDLRFVFSTGDFIDSLEVNGQVVDALTGEAVEEVLVMLYDNLADSVVRTERPFYFSRTDEQGNFRIRNVRADTFKVFALEDGNLNYRFDALSERIGFLENPIMVNDTSTNTLSLEIFTEEEPLRLVNTTHTRYGLSKLRFNRKPEDLAFRYAMDEVPELFFEYERDTVRIWYDMAEEQNWTLYVRKDTVLNDTVTIEVPSKTEFLETATLDLTISRLERARALNPFNPWELQFRHPLNTFDTAQIRLYEDTLRTIVRPRIGIDTTEAYRQLVFRYNWKEEMPYELELLPGAVTDIFGISNADSIVLKRRVALRKDFGSINLQIDSLDSDAQYVLQLIAGQDQVLETFIVNETTSFQQRFTGLQPGTFNVKIILDKNRNGRWDTGNYDAQRQPEPIYTHELEELRANWEVEAQLMPPDDFGE